MKRSSDSTHHCRSPTRTLNGCEVTPSTRTQSDLWHGPRICRNFVGEWNFVLLCYGHDKNHTGYHPALVKLFPRHLGIHSSWESTKQRKCRRALRIPTQPTLNTSSTGSSGCCRSDRFGGGAFLEMLQQGRPREEHLLSRRFTI